MNTMLNAATSQLEFDRDAMLSMELKADWTAIQARKRRKIDENNRRENSNRKAQGTSIFCGRCNLD